MKHLIYNMKITEISLRNEFKINDKNKIASLSICYIEYLKKKQINFLLIRIQIL